MEQKYLSVKQLAGEIGTNKLTIHRAINKLGLQGKLHKAGNRYMLSESQAKQIKSIILGENVSEIVSSTPKNVSIVSNKIVSNPSENVSGIPENVSNVSEIVSGTPENVSNVSKIVSNPSENISNVPENVSIVSNKIVSETHETQSMNIENTDKTYQPNKDLQLSILDRQLAVKDNQIQMLQEQIKLLQQQLKRYLPSRLSMQEPFRNSLPTIRLRKNLKQNSQSKNKDFFQGFSAEKIICD